MAKKQEYHTVHIDGTQVLIETDEISRSKAATVLWDGGNAEPISLDVADLLIKLSRKRDVR